ncbi:acyl carrier protein phosphodiesterase [Salinivirga cyanobacteriivorans]
MNYLAHLYLSGENNEVKVGNFIADAVKGRNLSKYPEGLQNGIKLHRCIDDFTDHHPIVLDVNKIFAPAYKKYAGIVTDMIFDHFLASNWQKFHEQTLSEYVDEVNEVLLSWFYIMPHRIQLMMPFWVKHRWPEIYSSPDGLIRALNGMPRYTSLPPRSDFVQEVLKKEQSGLQRAFNDFFVALSQEFYDAENN